LFSDQAKANPHTNCRDSNCGSEKRSFYRRRAPLRFEAAKTQSGHCDCETYIASGNVIFESNDSSAEGGTIPRRSSSAQLLEATGLVPERKPTEPDPE